MSAEEQQKDYEGMRAWHHEFKVHEVSPIPEASLPSKPQIYAVQSVEEFLRQGDAKVQETLSKTNQRLEHQSQLQDSQMITLPTLDFNGSGLSDRLIDMVTTTIIQH